MRISDIKGEAVIDLIADIIEPVANIAQDKAIAELFKREVVDEGADVRALAIDRLKKQAPAIIKAHKADVIAILAAISGEDIKTYAANLTIAKLMADVADVLSDSELVDFFISQAPQENDTDSGATSTSGDQQLTLA